MPFPTLLGHDAVVKKLRDALARDRLHHALLLEGPEGVGKHTLARALALTANCEADEPARPCGRCSSCVKIRAGTHPDVVEIGPDPNRATPTIPVDTIRDVVRLAGFHRFSARRRFVIVDPSDAMAAAAANALLKTLEEPPEGTHFVLITSTSASLLPTIVSRCQRVRLTPVPHSALVAWLTERGVDEPALLARTAQGCPGRALTLAEGGFASHLELRGRVLTALGADLKGIFELSEALTEGSRQDWAPRVEEVLAMLEELLRDAVVHAAGGKSDLVHADLAATTAAWSRVLWPGGIERCARAIEGARADLALNVNGKTALDALLTLMATELGQARKVPVTK